MQQNIPFLLPDSPIKFSTVFQLMYMGGSGIISFRAFRQALMLCNQAEQADGHPGPHAFAAKSHTTCMHL